jgi:hypothetical protein
MDSTENNPQLKMAIRPLLWNATNKGIYPSYHVVTVMGRFEITQALSQKGSIFYLSVPSFEGRLVTEHPTVLAASYAADEHIRHVVLSLVLPEDLTKLQLTGAAPFPDAQNTKPC